MAYMKSFNGKIVPIPAQIAKPVAGRRPNTCWVKGCFGLNPQHSNWQNCPKVAEYFRNSSDMETGA